MPLPKFENSRISSNRLIYEELSYDCEEQRNENEMLVNQLIDKQRGIYDTIIQDQMLVQMLEVCSLCMDMVEHAILLFDL